MDIDLHPKPREVSGFEAFVESEGCRLRRALVARFGVDLGNDIANDVMAYAWSHWARVSAMENRIGYLYRVGQSAARRYQRWRRRVAVYAPSDDPSADAFDDGLVAALAKVDQRQRVAVLLVHGYGYSYREVADVLDQSVAAVTNHVHRGLNALRRELGGRR